MKNKHILVLSGLVLVLSLYAYFGEYKREINEEVSKKEAHQIINLKKDQVQKIELHKGDTSSIVLERTVDGWNVLKPIQDQADNEIIEAFLDQITGETAVDQIEAQGTDLDQYGFKPSLGIVVLIDNAKRRQEVEISSKKNFEGLVFLRRDHENKILTSSATWISFLTKPADQFRNLRLFRGSISKINLIKLKNKFGSFDFRYNDGFWFSPQQTSWKIDQNAVRQILTEAITSKGTSIISETKPYGPVGAHLLTLELSGEKVTWKGLLHQDTKTKDVIGAVSPERMIIRFPPQTLEDLRTQKLIDFRDKLEPFRFQSDDVVKIVARTPLKSFTLIRKAESWHLDPPDKNIVINSTLAEDLIGKLKRMTVYGFQETNTKNAILDSEVELYEENNRLIFRMSWSQFTDHVGFAKTNLFNETFKIDDAQVNRLMFHEIVKPMLPETKIHKEQKEEKSEKN